MYRLVSILWDLRRSFLSPGKNRLGQGHQVSRAYGLPSGLARDLRRLRKAKQVIPCQLYPLHITWLNKNSFLPRSCFWAVSHGNYDHSSQEEEFWVFLQSLAWRPEVQRTLRQTTDRRLWNGPKCYWLCSHSCNALYGPRISTTSG